MYHFKALQGINMEQLAQCLNAAFSDYEQPIHFTTDSLTYYLTASGVNLSLSFGAFYDGLPVAVILNSNGIYNDQDVVFDAGTGVVPEHRGKKVFSQLFEYTCEELKKQNIAKYYLEVLQSNHHAVSIYSKKGFSVLREYSVLVAKGAKYEAASSVAILPYSEFEPFSTTCSVAPSFEHTSHTISRNPHLYEVTYLPNRAYCIYAKRNGEIIQLHYSDPDALKDVLAPVTKRFPSAMAKNIDLRYPDVLQALTEIGFVEVVKQYEMVRDI